MRARSLDGWTLATLLLALLVAGPLIGLPLAFVVAPDALSQFWGFVPDALVSTLVLVLGVGTGTLLLGTTAAALVSFCDFPGRGWIEWALVLPLAMPGYVFTLFVLGLDVQWVRSSFGAVLIFTLVLYPYVYLLGRAAFLAQSRTLLEAARGLGLSRRGALLRVGLPLARPAILGGVALALMEALADFGTVNLLNVPTFTNAIYKVWFNALRPRRRDAARPAAGLGDAHAAGARALPARPGAPRPARRAWRRGAADPPARPRGGGGGGAAADPGGRGRDRAAGAAGRLVGAVDPGRAAGARVRPGGAQQPAAGRHERRARAGARAAAGLRRARLRLSARGRGGAHGYHRLWPAGLGGRRRGDRPARLARPADRRRRRLVVRSRRGIDPHRDRDRTVLRLCRALPCPRLGRGRGKPAAHPARARRRRPRAWAPTASTCWRACTSR